MSAPLSVAQFLDALIAADAPKQSTVNIPIGRGAAAPVINEPKSTECSCSGCESVKELIRGSAKASARANPFIGANPFASTSQDPEPVSRDNGRDIICAHYDAHKENIYYIGEVKNLPEFGAHKILIHKQCANPTLAFEMIVAGIGAHAGAKVVRGTENFFTGKFSAIQEVFAMIGSK